VWAPGKVPDKTQWGGNDSGDGVPTKRTFHSPVTGEPAQKSLALAGGRGLSLKGRQLFGSMPWHPGGTGGGRLKAEGMKIRRMPVKKKNRIDNKGPKGRGEKKGAIKKRETCSVNQVCQREKPKGPNPFGAKKGRG